MHYNNDQGQLWATGITLGNFAAITASVNAAAASGIGWARQALILLDVTDLDKDVGDLLDVYIDITPDAGATWINAIHFPQVLGNAAAQKHWAFLNPENTGTATINVTTDAAAGVMRQIGLTDSIRVRAVVTPDADDPADHFFTFVVKAYLRS